ncbi:MAG: FeoB-associated Cys-rich membrane protein [Fusicatenibacter sp.]|nr:FeoB-associated Cys-rich membrane protein [Lachnospiraceae bacterium]MDY2939061.1 FeoB-associated Cys-rich membrane protein [Fusicatenibacter sp.]
MILDGNTKKMEEVLSVIASILIGILIAGYAAYVIWRCIRKMKKGEFCDCGCGGCSGCSKESGCSQKESR